MIVLFALKQKKGGKFTSVEPSKLHFGGSLRRTSTITNACVGVPGPGFWFSPGKGDLWGSNDGRRAGLSEGGSG